MSRPICRLVGGDYAINMYSMPFMIGSSPYTSLRLKHDLNPVHVTITYDGSRFYVVPGGDVIIDGVQARKYTPKFSITNGSSIEFGGEEFTFLVQDTSEIDEQPTVSFLLNQTIK